MLSSVLPAAPSQPPPSEPSPPSSSDDERARRRGRQRNSSNWEPHQIDRLLIEGRAALPRGQQEWDKVAAAYNRQTGETADAARLKDKFNKLVSTIKPTGRYKAHTHPAGAGNRRADRGQGAWRHGR